MKYIYVNMFEETVEEIEVNELAQKNIFNFYFKKQAIFYVEFNVPFFARKKYEDLKIFNVDDEGVEFYRFHEDALLKKYIGWEDILEMRGRFDYNTIVGHEDDSEGEYESLDM